MNRISPMAQRAATTTRALVSSRGRRRPSLHPNGITEQTTTSNRETDGAVSRAGLALPAISQAQHVGPVFLCGHKPTRFSPNLLTGTCRGGSVRRAGGTKWGKVGRVREPVTTSDVPRHLPALGGYQGSGGDSRPFSGTTPQWHGHFQGRRGLPAGLSAPGVGAGAG